MRKYTVKQISVQYNTGYALMPDAVIILSAAALVNWITTEPG